jgi:predicted secreted protein
MMSTDCNVVGAAPVAGVIVGASPALLVTDGRPEADVDPDTVSSPPNDVNDANAIAATAIIANTLMSVFFGMGLLLSASCVS